MANLTSEAKVGLLVIVGSIVLLYLTFIVGKYQFGGAKGYDIAAEFDSVAGLDEKSSVRMAGVPIGTVEEVALTDSRARVIMKILPETMIKRGSEAQIKTMGLLGEKYIEIIPPDRLPGGSAEARLRPGQSLYIQPGETIGATVSPSDVDKLINQLSMISDDIKQVTGSLRQVFGTERGARSMEDILGDLQGTMANIRDFSETLQSDGGELVARLNDLARNLNEVVGENRDNLRVSLENIREASRSAELALASIENVTKKIDRGQGTLGKLVNDESVYNNIDSAARGISDYTSRIEKLETTVGFRTEYMFPQSKSYFTLQLQPKPDKYYLIEVVNDPYGKYTRTEARSTPPGGPTVVSETYTDRFKFTALFAKRWGGAALRLGLIESEGGIGADYFLLNDRLKFSFDAWNFNSAEPGNTNAHLKTTASYMLGNTVFVNGGFDNFLNRDRAAAFLGVGLRFKDEDLKYLLGSVPVP